MVTRPSQPRPNRTREDQWLPRPLRSSIERVEAVALGFEKDFLFGFSEFFDLSLNVLDALDDSPQLITRNVDWSAHGLLLVNM
jgi:hypothetical protein